MIPNMPPLYALRRDEIGLDNSAFRLRPRAMRAACPFM